MEKGNIIEKGDIKLMTTKNITFLKQSY